MKKMSDASCKRYRSVVFENPDFVPYFAQSTPSTELGSLNIGSRPSKRKTERWRYGFAIPDLCLDTKPPTSSVVGMSAAFTEIKEQEGELGTLREMHKKWPFPK